MNSLHLHSHKKKNAFDFNANLLTFQVLYALLGPSICLPQGPPLGGWGWRASLCVFELGDTVVVNVVVLLVMHDGIETPRHLKPNKENVQKQL